MSPAGGRYGPANLHETNLFLGLTSSFDDEYPGPVADLNI
jgi:hypothetical protein